VVLLVVCADCSSVPSLCVHRSSTSTWVRGRSAVVGRCCPSRWLPCDPSWACSPCELALATTLEPSRCRPTVVVQPLHRITRPQWCLPISARPRTLIALALASRRHTTSSIASIVGTYQRIATITRRTNLFLAPCLFVCSLACVLIPRHDNGLVPVCTHRHAASCVWDVHYLLVTGGLGAHLAAEEKFASIVAAAVHDFRHPGVSNAYLVRRHHPLAICHNDDAVLERFHVSSAYMVAREAGCEVFRWLTPEAYKRVRSLVISMVLATV
jgi:hypothetical protein